MAEERLRQLLPFFNIQTMIKDFSLEGDEIEVNESERREKLADWQQIKSGQ